MWNSVAIPRFDWTRKVSRDDPLLNAVAGAMGGMLGAIFTSPLEVVQIRLQSDKLNMTKLKLR